MTIFGRQLCAAVQGEAGRGIVSARQQESEKAGTPQTAGEGRDREERKIVSVEESPSSAVGSGHLH